MNKERSDSLLGRHLLEAEKAFITKHLQDKRGNVTHAAEALGVTHRHLCRRIKKLGITRSDHTP